MGLYIVNSLSALIFITTMFFANLPFILGYVLMVEPFLLPKYFCNSVVYRLKPFFIFHQNLFLQKKLFCLLHNF